MGSDLHVWSSVLSEAMMASYRMRMVNSWHHVDTDVCGGNTSFLCYFPAAEPKCRNETVADPHSITPRNGGVPPNATFTAREFRAASTEFLFSPVSDIVIQEAERQLKAVFGDKGAPSNLITVHLRWGDKYTEFARVAIDGYVAAIEKIVKEKTLDSVNVLLCTEDPIAEREFRQAAHPSWTIFLDHFYVEFLPFRNRTGDIYDVVTNVTETLHGKPGLWALGSLLVAMEATFFVLTTTSNWSRMINELRKNVVEPRCENCTYLIDLQEYGDY